MDFLQETRRIRLVTALGDGALGLRRMRMTEALSTPFDMEIEAVADAPDVDLDALLGTSLTVAMETMRDAQPRHFNAFVTEAEIVGARDRRFGLRLRAAPWPWFLGLQQGCRIFLERSAQEIVEQVFGDNGFSDHEFRLTKSYEKYEYCVQYNETDLNFVSRLLEHEGIHYWFEHDNGSHKLILSDSVTRHDPVPGYETLLYDNAGQIGGMTEEAVQAFRPVRRLRPTKAMLRDFNFLAPQADLKAEAEISRPHAMASARVYEYPGRYLQKSPGGKLADVRLEELQARHSTVEAEATARGVAAGATFSLADHPVDAWNAEHLVVAARHELTAAGYESGGEESERYAVRFECMPTTETFRPARRAPKPRIAGPQTARVVGKEGEEIDVDEHGRVLLSFHWLPGTASRRVRVAQGWTGAKFGAVSLPRIGDEVVVAFEGGDPDRPLVTGSVYNAEAEHPYPLPANKTVTTFKTSSSKGGGGFNELRFEDKKGEENVFLHAERDMDLRAGSVVREWVGHDRHAHVVNDLFLMTDNERHETVGADSFLTVAGALHEHVTRDRMTKVDGTDHLEAGTDLLAKIGSGLGLKVGMDADVKVGMNTGIDSGMNVHLKGGMSVVIEGGMSVCLKVGGSFVNISPAGVDIVGPMVKINSGGAAGSGSGASPGAPTAPTDATEPDEAHTQKPGAAPPGAPASPTEPSAFQVRSSPKAAALKAARDSGAAFARV